MLKKNNKGLSTIVATLIIILLVLVAVGIVWVVVRNVIQGGTRQIDINSKCLSIEVMPTKAVCAGGNITGGNDGVCNVTVARSTGSEEIGGVKIVFSNDDGDSNYIHDVPGNMAPLETKVVANIDSGIVNASKVEIIVYFVDESGNEQLCPSSSPLEF